MALIDRLRNLRTHLHAAEAAQPDCPHLQEVHGELRRVLYAAKHRGWLTPAEVAELDEPPAGGGTPKTPPEGE